MERAEPLTGRRARLVSEAYRFGFKRPEEKETAREEQDRARCNIGRLAGKLRNPTGFSGGGEKNIAG